MGNVAFIRPDLEDFREAIMADTAAPSPTPPKPKAWPKPLGRPPSIENRHPDELEIDDSYQRSTNTNSSQALIRKIANGWDWRMCLPLVVSLRADALYVIDGQHRLAAAKQRGDIPFLPCCISTYASVADEAEMFVRMNRVRKAIGKLDDFHASVAHGDEEAVAIRDMIVGAGFTVSRTTGVTTWMPGAVPFTEAIRTMMRRHGHKVCADALMLMSEAFPDEVLNAGSSTFRALVKIAVNGDAPNRDRLFQAILKENQQGWASYVVDIKGGTDDRAAALRQAFLMAYEDVGKAAAL